MQISLNVTIIFRKSVAFIDQSDINGCFHDLETYEGQMRARVGFQMNERQIQEKILHFGIQDNVMTAEQKSIFEKVGKAIQQYNDTLPPGKAPIVLKVTVVR